MRGWARFLVPWVVAAVGCRPAPPPLPPEVSVHLRGHREAVVAADGSLRPLVLGAGGSLDICLRTPPTARTAQWQAWLFVSPGDSGEPVYADPHHRLDTTLCFRAELPERLAAGDRLALCGRLRDGYDGREHTLPCRPLAHRADDGAHRRLAGDLGEVLRGREPGEVEAFLQRLDGLTLRAREAELPFLAVRIELIAVYYLRQEGTAGALARAEARLASLPGWLADDAATVWAAQADYERALVALAGGRELGTAWRRLADADRRFARVLHGNRLTVRMKQAEILARVGALADAADRLATALADCEAMECNPRLVPNARGVLAWLVVLDPLATDAELASAEGHLEAALSGVPPEDAVERANLLINRAHLLLRRREDPRPPLADAARRLDEAGEDGVRVRRLRHWIELSEGLAAVTAGDPGTALERCRAAGGGGHASGHPRLAAWAAVCAARAHRLRWELAAAVRELAAAVGLDRRADPELLGQSLTPGPGLRAEIYYRAARLEVERGDPAAAWGLLARLDELTARGAASAPCRGWSEPVAAERDRLLAALAELDGPASGRARRQRASIRRSLREELGELIRRRSPCPEPPPTAGDQGLGYRAFTVGGEVVLLHRDPGGGVTVARRAEVAEGDLLRRIRGVAEALAGRRSADRRFAARRFAARRFADRRFADREWRELTAPLAAALLPPPAELGPVTTWALHGVLQGVPLAALPLPGPPSGDSAVPRWLGETTTVTLRPNGIPTGVPERSAAPPLFVVDPRGDLAGGERLAARLRRLFPGGRALMGAGATRAAVRAALPAAGWLHVDAHGRFDPAVPELSSLLLADGPLTLTELAEIPLGLSFANLAGCRTGSWPVTADRGHFGLAGLLARRGARWVVASRGDLDDRLAASFNHEFYRRLAADREPVPSAFAGALEVARRDFPASAWASLLLLRGGGGQSSHGVTPPRGEGAASDGGGG